MSFYSGQSSLGSCNACGSPVRDGGQSGAYCSNNDCPNGYWGGKSPEHAAAEQEAARRRNLEKHEGWWSIYLSDDATYPSGYGSGLMPDRDEAVRQANLVRSRGLTLRKVRRVIGGELVEIDDDLLQSRGGES